jgi:hypothetical protein
MTSSSTLNRGYAEIVTSLLNTSQAHASLADAISSEVVDALKTHERKHDDMKKKVISGPQGHSPADLRLP